MLTRAGALEEAVALRTRLREATAHWHHAVEQHLDLLNPAQPVDRYQQILTAFFGFYSPWEATEIHPFSDIGGFLRDRRKVPALRQDLSYFGIDPATLPICRELPTCQTPAEALGAAYVIEGATLGGQVIFRHLYLHLGLTEQTGALFFYGYGPATSGSWRSFEQLLARNSNPETDETTLAAAQSTFRNLHTWLRQSL